MEVLSQTLLARLTTIGKEAEARREEIEANRCLPHDIIQEVKASGVLKLWVAKEYGGSEAHILDLLEAVQTCAYHNGSLGWVVAVTGTAGLCAGYLPNEDAAEIFGSPEAMVGGWAAPVGKALRVDGGLQISGKWAWGSGIRHASHIVGGVMIIPKAEGEKPQSALAYFEPNQVQLIDNWQVLGLKGSNSIDYEVKNVFVQEGKWIYFPVKTPVLEATLYQFSFMGALASGVASVGLGLAARALDELKKLSLHKVPNGAGRTLAERPLVQDQLARMTANYQSAKLFLENAIQKNWQDAEQCQSSVVHKSELRLAATHAAETSLEIIQQAYKLGGGSSIWDGVKLQELLRDAHVMSQHGLISSNNYEVAGRVAFELPVNEWLL